MSVYLYRLGRLAARRAWVMVLVWLLLLGGGVAGASGLGKPFTSKLSIPGTEFQRVLEDLETSLPVAAQGTATVIFSTDDGEPFSAEQQRAVAALTDRWSNIAGVDQVTDPFAVQDDLDSAVARVDDGRQRLADGRRKLSDGRDKLDSAENRLADATAQVDDNSIKISTGEAQLASAQRQLDEGQKQYDAGAAKLAQARHRLETGAARAESGRAKLAAAQTRLDEGQKLLTAKEAEVAKGRAQLDAAKAELASGRAKLETSRQQVAQLVAAYGVGDPRVQGAQAAIDQAAAELAAGESQLAEKEAQLNAGAATLAAKSKELKAGQEQLDAKRQELQAALKKLSQGRSELKEGEAKLAASRHQLRDGRAEIEANRSKLAEGRSQLAAAQDRIAAGQDRVRRGTKRLDRAERELPRQTRKLEQAERRLNLIEGLHSVNAGRDYALSQVVFTDPLNFVEARTKAEVVKPDPQLKDLGVRVDYSKDIAQEISVAGPAEVAGLVIAGLVLLVTLGSLLAAGLPLLVAVIGVAVGILGTVTATYWFEMNDVTPSLAIMLGLAVGIDYALFLVNRHREQLAQGMELEESIGRATGTAGSAVLFAGMTVIVALAALTLTGIPFLGVMGLAAAATVGVAVLVSLTLTPALLRLIGTRVLSSRARRQIAEKLSAEEEEAELLDAATDNASHSQAADRGHGWGGLVTRHPFVTLLLATIVLSVLALPAASLKLGLPDGSFEPHDSTSYRTYAATAQHFGEGVNGPIIAVAKTGFDPSAEVQKSELTELELGVGEQLKAVSGIEYVVPIGVSDDQSTLAFQIVPTTGPATDETTDLVHRLRADAPAMGEAAGVESLAFTGQTVANIDISRALAQALPLYLGVVVGLSLVLMTLVFRSIVVPVLATAGFLLSVAAAFGALVAVYQWGWLGRVFAVTQPGIVLSFLPILVIGILFGLAMDYQMFLVSGMREAYVHGHAARTAVRTGFSHGARVITAAALIMTSVFASFIHADLTMVRPIGFALAVGVLADAFIVRLTAVPAVMHLLGSWAWYLPKWMEKILPDLDVEGARLVTDSPAPGILTDHERVTADVS